MIDLNDSRARTAATLAACAFALSSPLGAEPVEVTPTQQSVAAETAILEREMQAVMAEMEALQAEVDDVTALIHLKFQEMEALNQRASVLQALLVEEQLRLALPGPDAGPGAGPGAAPSRFKEPPQPDTEAQ